MNSDFIMQNVAPYAASRIGVYNAAGKRVGRIDLGTFKPEYGARLYRFGWIADSHLGSSDATKAPEDLQRAYEFFNNKESVDFVIMDGDITHGGTAAQFQTYQEIKDTYMPDKTVYCICANHDQITPDNYTGNWKKYTGCGKNYTFTKGSDVFICLGSSTTSATAPINDDDITWLDTQLSTYKNKRCFVMFHYFIKGYAGDYGQHYDYAMGGTNLTGIKALLEKYPNCVWFSGHSHWDWKYQADESDANIARVANNGAWTAHVPSVAYPRQWINNAISDYNEGSQGAIVDVYDNYIDIRGISYNGIEYQYMPLAQYRLDTTLQTIATTYYSISNSLTNCATSNSSSSIAENAAYTAKITPATGYDLQSITVTMGGTNITSTAVAGGTISIAKVTGDITITATTTKQDLPVPDGAILLFKKRAGENGFTNTTVWGSRGTSYPVPTVVDDDTLTFDTYKKSYVHYLSDALVAAGAASGDELWAYAVTELPDSIASDPTQGNMFGIFFQGNGGYSKYGWYDTAAEVFETGLATGNTTSLFVGIQAASRLTSGPFPITVKIKELYVYLIKK